MKKNWANSKAERSLNGWTVYETGEGSKEDFGWATLWE